MRIENYSDEHLASLAAAGDERATDILMERYKNLVKKLAGDRYLPGGDRDDLIQEGMIGLFKAVRDFRSDSGSFPAFAKLCIKRQMAKALQSAARKKNAPLNNYTSIYPLDSDQKAAGDAIIPPDEDLNPETIVIGTLDTDTLVVKLDEVLSPLEKKVLSLMADGKNYREIAKILGKSPKSVDNARQRIRAKASLHGV